MGPRIPNMKNTDMLIIFALLSIFLGQNPHIYKMRKGSVDKSAYPLKCKYMVRFQEMRTCFTPYF